MYDEMARLFSASGFASIAGQLNAAMKNGVVIASAPANDDNLPPGVSKLGGRPDLPPDQVWPTLGEKSMIFLAQFRLEDVAPHDINRTLPVSGLLSFFYDQDEDWASGEENGQPTGCRVFFFPPDGTPLARRAWPDDLPEYTHSTACTLQFSHHQFLPFDDLQQRFGVDPEDEAYYEMNADVRWSTMTGEIDDEYFDGEHAVHSLLGYVLPMQPDYGGDHGRYWLELISGQQFPAGESHFEGQGWHHLCTIASDNHNKTCWGDMGELHFFITDDDLRNRRFDRVWYFKECY